MTETKRRVALWLLASLLFAATFFAFASANSATTNDAHAVPDSKVDPKTGVA